MQSDLDPDHIVYEGANWILKRDQRNQALFAEMRTKFGMTMPQCMEAIKIAKSIREQGGDHAA